MPRPSNSMVNMESDGFKVFNGLDQNLSDEEQIAKKMTASCEGLSFRGGKLSTNQFGYGCLPFDWTKSNQRGYGIMPSRNIGQFYTTVAKYDGVSSLDSNTHLQNIMNFTSTAIDSHDPRLLVSSGILNNVTVTADGNSLRGYVESTFSEALSLLPPTPTFNADSGAAGITGTYLYRITLADLFLNETGGGTAVAHTVNNQVVNVSVDLTGYDITGFGAFVYVRFFRSTDGGSTYYLLNQQSIGVGTTYTYADSTSDATLTGAGSYQLINPDPAPSGFYADYVIVDDNRVIAIATWENGEYCPNRVRWTVLTDSSQTSSGNCKSWRADDYVDIQNDNINENIVGYPGLGGRTYIFAKNGTWSMTGTGDPDKPFRFDQIDSSYGLYHHSIDNAGGYLIGRTRDGLATFNGSTLKPIANELSPFFENCLTIKADSGAYNFKKNRYYLTACDSRIHGSYSFNPDFNFEIVAMFRNTTICYDVKDGTYELYPGTDLQVIKNIQDSGGSFNIVGLGVSNDAFVFFDQAITGTTFSKKASIQSVNNSLLVSSFSISTNQLQSRKVNCPLFIDSLGNKFLFTDFASTISSSSMSGSDAVFVLNGNLPIRRTTSGDSYLMIIDSSSGTTTTPSAVERLTDNGNNYFLSADINNYTLVIDSDGSGQVYNSAGDLSVIFGTTVVNSSNLSADAWVSGVTSGLKYILNSINGITLLNNVFVPDTVYNFFKSPLFGTNTSVNTKCFRYVWLNVRGSGVLRVRTYLDGNTTVDETRYVTLSDRNKWVMSRVDLKGSTGDTMAVEIGMARGAGDFECQELTLWWRKLGRLRNA